jgi:hypothetical protein
MIVRSLKGQRKQAPSSGASTRLNSLINLASMFGTGRFRDSSCFEVRPERVGKQALPALSARSARAQKGG